MNTSQDKEILDKNNWRQKRFFGFKGIQNSHNEKQQCIDDNHVKYIFPFLLIVMEPACKNVR